MTIKGDQLPLVDNAGEPVARYQMSKADIARDNTNKAMLKLARENKPGVAWWWSIVHTDDESRVICNACNADILGEPLGLGITGDQCRTIDDHRLSHWQDLLPERRR